MNLKLPTMREHAIYKATCEHDQAAMQAYSKFEIRVGAAKIAGTTNADIVVHLSNAQKILRAELGQFRRAFEARITEIVSTVYTDGS